MGRHSGSAEGDLRQADLLRHILSVQGHVLQAVSPIGQADFKLRQQGCHSFPVLGVRAPAVNAVTNGAVNGAGIHIEVAQILGHALCQSALSGAGGAVNGNTDGFQ